MSVTSDADGALTGLGTVTTTATYSGPTVVSGDLLICTISFNTTTPSVASVVASGQAMTLVQDLPETGGASGRNADLQIWKLLNPSAGAKSIVITFVGTANVVVQASSFIGTSGVVTAFTGDGGDPGNSLSLPVTSAVGNFTYCVMSTTVNPPSINDISPGLIGVTFNTGARGVSVGKAVGASTVTYSDTLQASSTSGGVVGIGIDIAAAGGAARKSTLALMGVG